VIWIHNTLSRQKERFVPRRDGRVQMFVCGPTVYDFCHVGHGKTFVQFDLVARYLAFRGYRVEYVQNITDIDDKIIPRAREHGRNRRFADADRIRDQLAAHGVILEDSPSGVRWRRSTR
jgi:cysteinyl-tRNA synthetase